jgi:uncharacterized membrane protein
MNRMISFIKGLIYGAAGMYYFDPQLGTRRRALLRDQCIHLFNKTGDAADATLRDVQNRLYGTYAELRSSLASDHASDEVIAQRVRSKMGRYVTHPSSIEVACRNGCVTLSGPVLAHEVDDLLCAVDSVRGVREVDNQLEIHESSGNISALQGGGQRWGEPSALMQTYWSPATRLAVGAVGAKMMINCLARRRPGSMLGGTIGFGLFMRALTNLETKRLFGISGGRRGIDVHKTITIERPVEEVYRALADPHRYPHFSDMIKSVRDMGDGRVQKTIAGPAGAELKITECITREVPNEFISFRSEPDSPIQYAGCARFVEEKDNCTKVEINATYNPPGGIISDAAARIAGFDLKSQLDDLMMRAKAYIETGQEPHDAAARRAPQEQHA